MKASHVLTITVVVASVTWPTAAGSQLQQPSRSHNAGNPDSVMRDFKSRIDDYLKLHDKAVKAAPALKETHNPTKIKNAQDALGARIRELRGGAKQGDIFTPEIAARFKDLLSPALQGEDGRDAKRVLKDDAPAAVPLQVNAKYPSTAPLPTVPSKLLLNLPTLPKTLEYRIIQKHLILRDVEADLIVDFIPNAIR
jgi:hypothetical protein